jgi:hypothetical protein
LEEVLTLKLRVNYTYPLSEDHLTFSFLPLQLLSTLQVFKLELSSLQLSLLELSLPEVSLELLAWRPICFMGFSFQFHSLHLMNHQMSSMAKEYFLAIMVFKQAMVLCQKWPSLLTLFYSKLLLNPFYTITTLNNTM